MLMHPSFWSLSTGYDIETNMLMGSWHVMLPKDDTLIGTM